MSGWIGVDLDGTLAVYDHWRGEHHIGAPIPKMVERVKSWLSSGQEVRIFTARISGDRQGVSPSETYKLIQDWCEEHIGRRLPVTCIKDFGMIELWDDRAVQVEKNTGVRWEGRVAMLDFVVQSLASVLLFTGLWLMGNKRLLGPFLTAAAEIFTAIVGFTHHTWSIALIGTVLFFVQARNFIKWRTEKTSW